MGMCPSADIFYGYDLGGMIDDDWESTAPAWWQEAEDADESADWEDELATRLGWEKVPFPDDYPDTRNHWRRMPHEESKRIREEYEKSSPQYQAWAASLDRKRDLLAQIPVELDTYGHVDGDTFWAVRVKASVQKLYGCDSAEVKPLTVDPEWASQLARFVELLELDVPAGGPAWHFTCSYG
ncbi:hypothetical protein [Nocardia niwae]|uniref:hypothetical protein n=1 Tax=Nocardia niwae TaxID=626084 RepID=UPI0007A41A57|nr:hypothetical protein [Nocardia niwae]